MGRETLQQLTTRRIEGPVAEQCGDALVLWREGIRASRVEWRASSGIRWVQLQELLEVRRRCTREQLLGDVFDEFFISPRTASQLLRANGEGGEPYVTLKLPRAKRVPSSFVSPARGSLS